MLKLVQRVSHPSNKIYLRIHTIQIRNSTSPYPIRPGFGLGSMIPGTIIEGMKKEAHIRGKIIAYQQLYNDLESTERELSLEMNQIIDNDVDTNQSTVDDETKQSESATKQDIQTVTNDLQSELKKLQKVKNDILVKKMQAYSNLTEMTAQKWGDPEKTSSIDSDENIDSVSAFSKSIESPVDWKESVIAYLDRAEDSLQINAHFFDNNEKKQNAEVYNDNVSKAAGDTVKSKFGADVAADTTNSFKHSMTKTSNKDKIESTLLLSAIATHRYVKQFNPLHINVQKLAAAWNYFNKDDMVDPYNNESNYNKTNDTSKEIAMISEQFLGSCMIGMVHFIKKESTEATQETDAISDEKRKEKQKAARQAQENVSAAASLGGVTGDTSIANKVASKYMSEATSSSGIDVKFDIICQGYFPRIQSTEVTQSISEFVNFAPDKMQTETVDISQNMNSTDLKNINKQQGTAESNTAAMIKATILGLNEAYNSNETILDYKTFMTTFDNYTANAPKRPGAGIPLGMNVKTWNKKDVIKLLFPKKQTGNIFSILGSNTQDSEKESKNP
eukprot:450560_1